MIKTCVVCGESFKASPTDKKVTCGLLACVSENKSRTHTGKKYPWSEEARLRNKTGVQTDELKLGAPAAHASPLAGPFETNQHAKIWWVVSPEGSCYEVRNLRNFCREHADLFAPDHWEKARAGLGQVQAWLIGKTPRTVSQWKGWTLKQPAITPEDSKRWDK